MTMIDSGSFAKDIYRVPENPQEPRFESPQAIRPVVASEIQQAHAEMTRLLQEEAVRLASSSTPLSGPMFPERQVRPEIGPPQEVQKLAQNGREITRVRSEKLKEKLRHVGFARYANAVLGTNYQEIMTNAYKNLVDQEATAVAKNNIFLQEPPQGEEWKFYYENSNEQDEWFFERKRKGQKDPYSVVRYVRQPYWVRKVENGQVSVPLERDEMLTLANASDLYLQVISEQVYHTKHKSDYDLAA